jgi:heptosyltransferase-2
MSEFEFRRNCKSFPGKWACDIMTAEGYMSCKDCKFYEPISKRILIIKLGAMGDVIRTTPLLKNIKKKYGDDIQITWLVNKESAELIKNEYVDRILVYNQDNILRLQLEEFDVLFSLEHDTPGSAIANLIKAKEKYGYYLNKDGHPNCFNEKARFYLERVFSNYINKNNNRTYQDMMGEICEINYNEDECILNFDKEYGKEFLRKNHLGINDKFLGIHMGSGGRWPSKVWSRNKLIEFVKQINNYKIILFAGPNEIKEQEELIDELSKEGVKIYVNDPNNTAKEFISLVSLCDTMLVNDSFALHVSIALKKKTIALFFCTPPWEIEGYGLVKKIVSPLLSKYFYNDEYVEELVNSISADEVLKTFLNN